MRAILTITLALVSADALADRFDCQQGGLNRSISVQHPSGSETPCEVRYEKPDEGVQASTPWRANNTPGYCKEKAAYLADRLRSLGWTCTFSDSKVDPENSN